MVFVLCDTGRYCTISTVFHFSCITEKSGFPNESSYVSTQWYHQQKVTHAGMPWGCVFTPQAMQYPSVTVNAACASVEVHLVPNACHSAHLLKTLPGVLVNCLLAGLQASSPTTVLRSSHSRPPPLLNTPSCVLNGVPPSLLPRTCGGTEVLRPTKGSTALLSH